MLNLALIAYVVATGLALAYLVQREEVTYRLTTAVTLAGWALQTAGLIARTVEGGRGPFSSFPEAVSVAVWAAVLLALWAERQYRIRVLGPFVLPVVVVLSVSGTMAGPALQSTALHNVWITVHVVLALLGIAAFVLNFAGSIMYLLQERQLKARRPGTFYYRLPSLETLRSEEHTSELQSHLNIVSRLLLEKKKTDLAHTCISPDLVLTRSPTRAQ